jgi:hypothetical protein
MRIRAAQKRHVEHSRQLDVFHVASFAGNQGTIFDAAYGRADKSSRGVLHCHDETAHLNSVPVACRKHTDDAAERQAHEAWMLKLPLG